MISFVRIKRYFCKHKLRPFGMVLTPVIRVKFYQAMQIAVLARTINEIKGCEDYENTFPRMKCNCTLIFGFKKYFMNQTIKFVFAFTLQNALAGPEALSRSQSCSFWQRWRILVCPFTRSVLQMYSLLKNINNTLLIYNWWSCFLRIQLSFNFPAHKLKLHGAMSTFI